MIHPTAIVDSAAEVAHDAEIGPYAIVEGLVKIGPRVKVWPHVHICAGTTVGEDTQIHAGAVLGDIPQDLAFRGQRSTLVIGNRNVIREHVTIHRGTKEGSSTVIGDDCYLMAVSHIGHNSEVADKVIIANGALLAGYVQVGEGAFISGNVVIHQYCRIGTLAMIGGFSGVNKDVPPYMLLRGPSVVRSVNLVGLRRAKFSAEAIREIKEAFRLLYKADLNIRQALAEIEKLGCSKELATIVDFVTSSKRGICDPVVTDEEFFG